MVSLPSELSVAAQVLIAYRGNAWWPVLAGQCSTINLRHSEWSLQALANKERMMYGSYALFLLMYTCCGRCRGILTICTIDVRSCTLGWSLKSFKSCLSLLFLRLQAMYISSPLPHLSTIYPCKLSGLPLSFLLHLSMYLQKLVALTCASLLLLLQVC